MKSILRTAIAATIVLLSACTGNSGIAHFWDGIDVSVSTENYIEAQDRFAGFAELTADAPYREASAALDGLLGKLASDEVSYLVYSEWIVSAFHSILSPARNPRLFARAVDRFKADGIVSAGELKPLLELAARGSAPRFSQLRMVGAEPRREHLRHDDHVGLALQTG